MQTYEIHIGEPLEVYGRRGKWQWLRDAVLAAPPDTWHYIEINESGGRKAAESIRSVLTSGSTAVSMKKLRDDGYSLQTAIRTQDHDPAIAPGTARLYWQKYRKDAAV